MQNNEQPQTGSSFVEATTEIASAIFSNPNNAISLSDVPNLITSIHGALAGLGQEAVAAARPEPKVPIRSSIKPDYIVCLEDGKRLKMLKRHLMTHYGLTPDQYRAKWGLAADYPMVAPNYAETRRDLAKKIGLGHSRKKSTTGTTASASRAAPKAGRRGRRKAGE